jgi:hypothetical protein
MADGAAWLRLRTFLLTVVIPFFSDNDWFKVRYEQGPFATIPK